MYASIPECGGPTNWRDISIGSMGCAGIAPIVGRSTISGFSLR